MKWDEEEENERPRRKRKNPEGIMTTTHKTKPEHDSNIESGHATSTNGSPTGMPKGRGNVHIWRYKIYWIPPASNHTRHVIVSPKQIPTPNEDL